MNPGIYDWSEKSPPTPEQIEERARAIREQNLAKMREGLGDSRSPSSTGLRAYSRQGRSGGPYRPGNA